MERMGFLQDDKRYGRVRCSSSKIMLVCSDFLDYLNCAQDSSFDMVYVSNLFDHMEDLIARCKALGEIKKILRPGGKFYCSSADSYKLRNIPLKEFFEEDREAYQRGLSHSQRDCLGSPSPGCRDLGDFFIGIKP